MFIEVGEKPNQIERTKYNQLFRFYKIRLSSQFSIINTRTFGRALGSMEPIRLNHKYKNIKNLKINYCLILL